MTTPRRYQRSRAKGARLPPGTVCVTRGTRWGNPHRAPWTFVPPGGLDAAARATIVRWFREDLLAGRLGVSVEDVRRELRGRDLACWCPLPEPGEPDHCHAAVLLEVANAPEQ